MPPKSTKRTRATKTGKSVARRSQTPALSASHKRAMAEGRRLSTVVDRYLAALNTRKPAGRRVSTATLRARLVDARTGAARASGVERLVAAQAVRDLQGKLAQRAAKVVDLPALEAEFVKVAKKFGEKRGVGYGAWRDAGVPPQVLKRAGVKRTRG